jgi:hypothetical protein
MSTTAVGTHAVARPISVAVVAIIAFIQGSIAILGGLGFLIERNSSSLIEHIGRSSGTIATYGVVSIIWGALALIVGYGLWRAGNWARLVVAILQVLALAGGVYMLFAWDGHYLWQGIWQIVVSLFVLWLLYNPRADDFFHSRGV